MKERELRALASQHHSSVRSLVATWYGIAGFRAIQDWWRWSTITIVHFGSFVRHSEFPPWYVPNTRFIRKRIRKNILFSFTKERLVSLSYGYQVGIASYTWGVKRLDNRCFSIMYDDRLSSFSPFRYNGKRGISAHISFLLWGRKCLFWLSHNCNLICLRGKAEHQSYFSLVSFLECSHSYSFFSPLAESIQTPLHF